MVAQTAPGQAPSSLRQQPEQILVKTEAELLYTVLQWRGCQEEVSRVLQTSGQALPSTVLRQTLTTFRNLKCFVTANFWTQVKLWVVLMWASWK
jgi:hypothetical protein